MGRERRCRVASRGCSTRIKDICTDVGGSNVVLRRLCFSEPRERTGEQGIETARPLYNKHDNQAEKYNKRGGSKREVSSNCSIAAVDGNSGLVQLLFCEEQESECALFRARSGPTEIGDALFQKHLSNEATVGPINVYTVAVARPAAALTSVRSYSGQVPGDSHIAKVVRVHAVGDTGARLGKEASFPHLWKSTPALAAGLNWIGKQTSSPFLTVLVKAAAHRSAGVSLEAELRRLGSDERPFARLRLVRHESHAVCFIQPNDRAEKRDSIELR